MLKHRYQIFEWEDFPWFPSSIRRAQTDYMKFVVQMVYATFFERFRQWIRQSKTTQIVDVCSGGGGPWTTFKPKLGHDVLVTLTDKYPNLDAFQHLHETIGTDYIPTPVGITQIPSYLKGSRTCFTAFHHFEESEAIEFLSQTIRSGEPLCIAEVTERTWFAIISAMIRIPIFSLFITCFTRPFRWSKVFWTWIVPVIPLIMVWDGVVSHLRTYHPEEMLRMVERIPQSHTYQWETGRQSGIAGSHVTFLFGIPKKRIEKC